MAFKIFHQADAQENVPQQQAEVLPHVQAQAQGDPEQEQVLPVPDLAQNALAQVDNYAAAAPVPAVDADQVPAVDADQV